MLAGCRQLREGVDLMAMRCVVARRLLPLSTLLDRTRPSAPESWFTILYIAFSTYSSSTFPIWILFSEEG